MKTRILLMLIIGISMSCTSDKSKEILKNHEMINQLKEAFSNESGCQDSIKIEVSKMPEGTFNIKELDNRFYYIKASSVIDNASVKSETYWCDYKGVAGENAGHMDKLDDYLEDCYPNHLIDIVDEKIYIVPSYYGQSSVDKREGLIYYADEDDTLRTIKIKTGELKVFFNIITDEGDMELIEITNEVVN